MTNLQKALIGFPILLKLLGPPPSSNGDIHGITHLLSNDILFAADGGGKVRTAINIIEGKERVLALISGIAKKFFFGKSATAAIINNQYGIVVTENEKITGVFCFAGILHPKPLTRFSM